MCPWVKGRGVRRKERNARRCPLTGPGSSEKAGVWDRKSFSLPWLPEIYLLGRRARRLLSRAGRPRTPRTSTGSRTAFARAHPTPRLSPSRVQLVALGRSADYAVSNGFTAILTKFSGHQTGRYFKKRIKSQMVYYFGP